MAITITISRADRQDEPWVRRLTRRSLLAFVAAVAVVAAAGGVAAADGPAAGAPLLRGCYSVRTGALRLITAPGAACRTGEKAVSWNQTGFHWAGQWHSTASYLSGDAVSYQGSSYIATADSSGKVPSLATRFWAVLAAAGQPGPPGAGGAGALAFAEFYQANPIGGLSDGQAMTFGSVGPSRGGVITQASPTTFQLAAAGIYEVSFQIPILDEGEFQLSLNGTAVPGTTVGTEFIEGHQVVGDELVSAGAGDTLSVTASGFAEIFGHGPGAPLTATLVIKLLSHS
jgi:hypothetical protein